MKSVTLLDDATVDVRDLSAQFYLAEADAGKKRAAACKDRLQELNTAVAVSVAAGWPTDEELLKFQVRMSLGFGLVLASGSGACLRPRRQCAVPAGGGAHGHAAGGGPACRRALPPGWRGFHPRGRPGRLCARLL